MEILRNDFTRFCSIDIETDSTVEADEATEKEANAQIMQVIGGVMTAGQGLLAERPAAAADDHQPRRSK